jgi:tRNA threonylcarbamoyladenosine biosynthesis protein TsaB
MLGHNQTMLVAALDTTTRLGSLAIVRDQRVLAARVGDDARPHAARQPGDLIALLGEQGLTVHDVDVFAVAIGPGSFTGLRIGLAVVQGLAFATGRPVVGVSAFEAVAAAVWAERPETADTPLAIWLDAQRREVFATVLTRTGTQDASNRPEFEYVEVPSVASPPAILKRWMGEAWWGAGVMLAGDGALTYRDLLAEQLGPEVRVVAPTPLLAPAIGWLAEQRATAGRALPPHEIKLFYVRRSDVELARDRQRESGA